MNPLNYLLNPLKRILDFNGRCARKEFWLYLLALALCWMIASFVSMFLSVSLGIAIYGADGGAAGGVGAMIAILSFWLGQVILLPAIYARRLHDMNITGWLQLIFFIPHIGFLVMCIFMCLPGTPGENRFGPPQA